MTLHAGEDPAIVVRCPGCDMEGQIRFSRLPNVVHCPQCGVRFWIDARGKVRSEREATHLRFVCPRCGHRERMPVEFVAKGTTCEACQGRFYPGKDGRFHASEQLKPKPTRPEKPARPTTDSRRRMPSRKTIPAITVALGCAMILAAVVGWTASREPLETIAVRFTEDCLARNTAPARARVTAAGKRAFQRWLFVAFPQLADPLAPPERGAEVSIHELLGEGDTARVRLVVRQPGRGSRLQTQYWRLEEHRWAFDAPRTLAAVCPDD